MEPFHGLGLRFSKRWEGMRERYFYHEGLNWYGDNTNQRETGMVITPTTSITKQSITKPYFPNGILGMPFIILAAAAGLENCFITLRISSNCLISLFTSVILVPEPLAIRVRRF